MQQRYHSAYGLLSEHTPYFYCSMYITLMHMRIGYSYIEHKVCNTYGLVWTLEKRGTVRMDSNVYDVLRIRPVAHDLCVGAV